MNTPLLVLWNHTLTLWHLLVLLGAGLLAFLLGWLAGRSGAGPRRGLPRQAAAQRSASDDAFLKGLTHLMADHTDQAIEEFTRAVTLNSDTVETYVVLGNLFRQKGEIERAVRIRQSIIARPNLAPPVRLQAMYDLGLDYRKGGLFNRAVEAFQEVLNMDPQHVEACRQVVSLHEEVREWDKAFEALKRLDKLTGGDSRAVLAHYKTELGKEYMFAGQLDRAEEAFDQAIRVYKGCLDAYLHLGDLELARGRSRKALSVWRKAVHVSPTLAHLVVNRVAAAEETLGQRAAASFYDEIDPGQADVTTLQALAESYHRHGEDQKALGMLDLAVERAPQMLDAHRLRGQILLAQERREEALKAYAGLLGQIDGEWHSYQCAQCGFVSHQLTWKCPRCHQWDSMSSKRQTA
ncbi:MAG: tetratricopeptide repeat protein [Desulfarculus sp.]|nr:tetratricopeptide repeat protein [Desulfarculus sp.]